MHSISNLDQACFVGEQGPYRCDHNRLVRVNMAECDPGPGILYCGNRESGRILNWVRGEYVLWWFRENMA
ncbi:uncharacterized protein L3040_005956 [Drepanopeziza brunnea f. sp. 'multigermtubi']|uniref:uncharacterized protein n=1 Tax=Drepanopeziza brunnea f. sp. 'multigermtubi' TaxID=698441 RepID=UPI002386640F|nr:hypothetical protein L3040_005956 [Drepanopeziza brunnea f. sp. 'multigermtubi']